MTVKLSEEIRKHRWIWQNVFSHGEMLEVGGFRVSLRFGYESLISEEGRTEYNQPLPDRSCSLKNIALLLGLERESSDCVTIIDTLPISGSAGT